MERGYLIAVLAIVATFTGISHGFRSVENWSLAHLKHSSPMGKAECPTKAAAQAVAKLRTHLRPHYAEEAQLLAEMNVPMADAQSAIAEEMSRQAEAMSVVSCARARAMQDAARAHRDMLRMQRDVGRIHTAVRIDPMSLHIELPADFEQQIANTSAAAAKIAARQVQLRIAIDRAEVTNRCRNPQ